MPGFYITHDDHGTPNRRISGTCDGDTKRHEIIAFAKGIDERAEIFGWADLRLDTNKGTWSITIYTD